MVSMLTSPRKRGKSMARDRHQAGWVEETGTKVKKWKGHYYVYVRSADGTEKRKHHSVTLGLKAQMRKWEAARELQHIIERETAGPAQSRPDSGASFGWFVKERYLPLREGNWRTSTRRTNLDLLEKHVLPTFESLPLCEIDKFMLQQHVTKLAGQYSFSVVDHVRNFLKSILEEAVELDFLTKNPARKLSNGQTRKPVRRVLTFEQLRLLLGALSECDRLIVLVAAIAALRPGELFALRRSSFRGDHFQISETVYRGKIRPVAKTDASLAPVALPKALAADLERWLSKCVDQSPEALIFPTSRGTPILKENFIRHRLKPAGTSAGVPWINFQVLRRSFATLAHDTGASLKDVQGQLRHSHVSTTADIYTQSLPESVRAAVESVIDRLIGEPLSTKPQ